MCVRTLDGAITIVNSVMYPFLPSPEMHENAKKQNAMELQEERNMQNNKNGCYGSKYRKLMKQQAESPAAKDKARALLPQRTVVTTKLLAPEASDMRLMDLLRLGLGWNTLYHCRNSNCPLPSIRN